MVGPTLEGQNCERFEPKMKMTTAKIVEMSVTALSTTTVLFMTTSPRQSYSTYL